VIELHQQTIRETTALVETFYAKELHTLRSWRAEERDKTRTDPRVVSN
jgi:hypothetical protein